MSSKLESDVCCRLQVAPSGESYGGKPQACHVTCGLTACTQGSAPGPALGNGYGKTLLLLFTRHCKITRTLVTIPAMMPHKKTTISLDTDHHWWHLRWSLCWVCDDAVVCSSAASVDSWLVSQQHQQTQTLVYTDDHRSLVQRLTGPKVKFSGNPTLGPHVVLMIPHHKLKYGFSMSTTIGVNLSK